MLKKVKQKTIAMKQNWHDQFAIFKKRFRAKFDRRFPKPYMEIEDPSLELQKNPGEQTVSISKKIWLFWLSGLVVVALGYFLYDHLNYIYILLGAFIISLAMESVVIFWQRLTSSRGL
ncbi:MAG: hypothetical protein LBI53_08315 [Candidatus Peribacteria bacterium]|jgi:hypothetical protein|nr:hypothetical protein [Candidatus Peribacteria bacterium]